MKLKGQVVGILRDVNTGEITNTFEGWNHLQDHFLADLCTAGSISTFEELGQDLFISDTNPGKQRRDWAEDIPNVRGGSVIAGVDQVTIDYDYAPGVHLGTFVQRFSAPASDYTIHIAGLCQNIQSGTIANQADTVVWLSTPCVQTTTETLDLYYRVQLLFEDDWSVFDTNPYHVNPYEAKIIAGFLFSGSPSYPLPTSMNPFGFGFSKYNGRKLDEPNSSLFQGDTFQIGGTGLVTSLEDGQDYFVRRCTAARDIQTGVGKLVGNIATPTISKSCLIKKLAPTGFSPIQSVFGHRSTSATPFYNAAASQFSLGTLTLDGAAWTDPDFPKYIRMDITTSGLVGVGEYQFRIRNHFGFLDNTWSNGVCPLFFTQGNQAHWYNDGFAWSVGDRDESNFTTAGGEFLDRGQVSHAYPVDADNVFVVNKDEFAVVNIHTGVGTAITNTTLVGLDVIPNFLPTDISQVAIASNGDYYISCRDTGLYHLNAALDTLVVIDSSTTGLSNTTGCKAVCVGQGSRLWTYWDHATTPDIYYSDNGGVSWTAAGYSETFVDANPGLVFNIQADPNAAGGEVALLHYDADGGVGDAQQEIHLKWWNHGTTTAFTFGQIKERIRNQANYAAVPDAYGVNYNNMHLLQCSPNDSKWATVGYGGTGSFSVLGQVAWFTHGSASVSDVLLAEDIGTLMRVTQFVPDAAGNDAVLYISDKGACNGDPINGSYTCLVSQNLTYEALDSTTAGTNDFDGQWALCYLHDGVWLGVRAYNGDFLAFSSRSCYYLYSAIPDTADFDAAVGMTTEFYDTYGWTGSAWVKGNAGARTLHATAEELIDGVTVAWDDATGTNSFLDSDHYTFGVFDGIWLDGSTQFDFRWDLYAKPSTWGTDVEASTLPATTKVSNNFITELPDDLATDYQDDASTTVTAPGSLTATGTAGQGVYNAGARSVNPAIDGDASSFLPNQTYIPGTDTSNCQGYIEFDIYYTTGVHVEQYVGVSAFPILGTALNAATIAHAIHFDSVTPAAGLGTCRVRVTENGVEKGTVYDDVPYNTTAGSLKGRIALLTNGSMLYEFFSTSNNAWLKLYESPAASVTIENLYLDTIYVPNNTYGLKNLEYNYLDTSNPDYYLYLGDGIDQGVFQPTFRAVDPDSVTVLIDGVEGVHVGINDTDTVLPANSYSIYPAGGVIRYSANDTGLSVSAEYITVHDE